MKLVLLVGSALLLGAIATCQDVQQQCGNHPNLLRDASGQLKWLTSEELRKTAVILVEADPVPLPGGMIYSGFVTARVMVSATGEVVCMWGASGHPVMIPAAVRAIHQWKFKPRVVGGKRVEFVGLLKVPVRSGGAPR